jgi:hypothetical protein
VNLDPNPGGPKTCESGSGTLPGTVTSGHIKTLAGSSNITTGMESRKVNRKECQTTQWNDKGRVNRTASKGRRIRTRKMAGIAIGTRTGKGR